MLWADKTTLGRTGLSVGRIGLGSSCGASARDVGRAFEHGVTWFQRTARVAAKPLPRAMCQGSIWPGQGPRLVTSQQDTIGRTARLSQRPRPMKLATKLEEAFDEGARKVGRALVRRRRVRLLDWDDRVACAEVRAPEGPQVVLLLGDELRACSCDGARRLARCAHAWAVILVADQARVGARSSAERTPTTASIAVAGRRNASVAGA